MILKKKVIANSKGVVEVWQQEMELTALIVQRLKMEIA